MHRRSPDTCRRSREREREREGYPSFTYRRAVTLAIDAMSRYRGANRRVHVSHPHPSFLNRVRLEPCASRPGRRRGRQEGEMASKDEEKRNRGGGGEGKGEGEEEGKDWKGRWCKDRTIVCFLTAISSQ